MVKHTVAAAMVLAATTLGANAQTMHKCKGADGRTTYQQTPCASDSRTVEQRAITREADSPDAMWENLPSQQAPRGAYQGSAAAPYETPVGESQSAYTQAEIESAQQSEAFHRRVGRKPIAGTRPVTQQALPASAPPPAAPPPVRRTGPDPNRPFPKGYVQDQHGTRYFRPEGSHFVTDPKSGRQCLAVGATIRCPP